MGVENSAFRFNQPGLALWLNDASGAVSGARLRSAMQSAVRLALKDAFPDARFSHFLDTNGIAAPLVIETQADGRRAVYFPGTPEEAALAGRHLASLARAGIVSPEGLAVTMDGWAPYPPGTPQQLRQVPLLTGAGAAVPWEGGSEPPAPASGGCRHP